MTIPFLFSQSTLPLWDLDATVSASYNGAGGTWHNLVENPADGSSQSTYDFTIMGTPTFTGTPGDSAAYFAMDGASYFQIAGGNTPILSSLHQNTNISLGTITPNPTTIIFAFKTDPALVQDVNLFGTEGGLTAGSGLYGMNMSLASLQIGPPSPGAGPSLQWQQWVNGHQVNSPTGGNFYTPPGGVPVASTDYLLSYTNGVTFFVGSNLPGNLLGCSCAINTTDMFDSEISFGSLYDSTTATGPFCIGSAGDGYPVGTGTRIYGCYGFAKILSDDELTDFVAVLNARQGNRWVF